MKSNKKIKKISVKKKPKGFTITFRSGDVKYVKK